MKKCVFAGTFDPFTVGHADTVDKCLKLFDEVVLALAENHRKQCMFSPEERLGMLEAVYRDEERVRIVKWDGVIADLLMEEKTPFYVRGVRNTVDFTYETTDYYATKRLYPDVIPVYIPAEQELLHVSSTLVRNSILFGKPYSSYVPAAVSEMIEKRGKHV